LSSKPVRYATTPFGTGTKLAQPERSKLPIEHPTKFTLAINAKTAKQLGISIPPALQVGADELIDLT